MDGNQHWTEMFYVVPKYSGTTNMAHMENLENIPLQVS